MLKFFESQQSVAHGLNAALMSPYPEYANGSSYSQSVNVQQCLMLCLCHWLGVSQ